MCFCEGIQWIICSGALYRAENLYPSENISLIPGKFWNVVLEKDGKDQSDRLREKWRSITESQGEEIPTYIEIGRD